jgi:hypothetical protein
MRVCPRNNRWQTYKSGLLDFSTLLWRVSDVLISLSFGKFHLLKS